MQRSAHLRVILETSTVFESIYQPLWTVTQNKGPPTCNLETFNVVSTLLGGFPPKRIKPIYKCLLTGFHGDLPETESNYTFLWRGVSSVHIHLCTHTPLLGISQNPSVYLQIIWGRLPVPNSLFMPTLRKHSSLHASLRTLWHINIVTGPSRGPPPERMGLYSGDFPRAGMRNPVTLTEHLQGPGVAPWSSGVCLQALCEGTRTALVPLDPLSLGPPRALYPAYGAPGTSISQNRRS